MFATRMERLGTETAFEVLARARELERTGRDIVHLEIGEPDMDTPKFIVEAAVQALREGWTHYGPSAGDPEVRATIAEHVNQARGLHATADNVVVTPGAKPILFFSLLACVNEGDEVIYPDPGFPIYESVTRFLNAKPVPLVLKEATGFATTAEALAPLLTDRTRFVILNSPHNPTGAVTPRKNLEEIAALLRDRDLFVLTDEVYSRIQYEGVNASIASLPGMEEKTIVLDGHSKTYAMTGWRMGYGVMRKDLAQHVTRLMTNSNSCTNVFVQRAGRAALLGPQGEIDAMIAEFRRRKDVIVRGLNAIPGVSCFDPLGAFYAFPNISRLGIDSRTLARDLLDKAGVAALSGTAFGQGGDGYLRFSYANSIANIEKALGRMAEYLAANQLGVR